MKLALKHVLTAIILILSLAAPVAAGPHEDARAAFKSGDYATTLRLLRPLANQGNASAQNNLGVMYRDGLGVPQDYLSGARGFTPDQMTQLLDRTNQGNPSLSQGGGVVSDAGPNAPTANGYTAAQNAALRAKAQQILDAQTKAAPNDQPTPLPPRTAPGAPAAPPARTGYGVNPFDLKVGQSSQNIVGLPGVRAAPAPAPTPAPGAQPPRTGYNAGTGAPSVGTTACQRYPNLC